jgi:hypothetical protein
MAGEQFTGLWTQRSPYRDAATAYLVKKFYQGSRFDSIWDGTNREIGVKLTDVRAPGSSVYNNDLGLNDFPAALSFASWKFQQQGAEQVRVLMDGADQNIYDATAGQKTTLLTKGTTAPARMLGVNTELFVGDGLDQKKVLRSAKVWQAGIHWNVGDFIVDSNGNIQSIQANPVTAQVTSTKVVNDPAFGNFVVITLTATAPVIPPNQTASFSGLTGTGAYLNGATLLWQGIPASTLALLALATNQIAFATAHATYAPSAGTGNMIALTANSGVSGLAEPAWSATWGAITNDNGFNFGVNWTCFGNPAENWGLAGVPAAPPNYSGTYPAVTPTPYSTILATPGVPRFWSPNAPFAIASLSILDPNGNIQVGAGSGTTGRVLPAWGTAIGQVTLDGSISWVNYGPVGAGWFAATVYGGATAGAPNVCVIVDNNGNLQSIASSPAISGTSGATAPTWATSIGSTTTDGTITWVCSGPAGVLWSGTLQYAWSPVGIDGTVGTASPVTLVANGGLGTGFQLQLTVNITGTAARTDLQCAQIALWRTAQGQATLILLDYIPNPWLLGNTSVTYMDVSSDLVLGQNATVPAPIDESADPPPLGALPMCYALQRVWYIVGNRVMWTAGPDAVTGNGLTQCPPLNFIAFMGKPYAIFPITVQDGGQVVFTSSGMWIILGQGTASDPFYARPYFQSVNVSGFNAVTLFNQNFFVMEANGKVSSVAVEFPFQPATGYTEIGFPIGDQFRKVTTGGINAALFDPAAAFVSWNSQATNENALYVADGAGHWFRMSAVSPPESGLLWHPIRTLLGGSSAVQAVETSPGVTQLLIGPATSGPILCRDNTGTVYSDPVAGTPTGYPSWDAKGVNLLCSTGQWAEVAHISAKSAAVGARPVVSVLLNEIQPSTARPYNRLEVTGNDPADTPKSVSVFSDRYDLAQNGVATTGDSLLTKFDYGAQAAADELLDWGIYGGTQDEQQEAVAKS